MIDLNSKIYIAGHKGLVGSAILRKLKKKGYKKILTADKSKLDLTNQSKVYNFLKKEINFNSNTSLIIKISETESVLINLTKESYFKFIKNEEIMKIENFVKISLDIRLLYNILSGPRYAHWNNAEIGSHLVFERKPNIFERGLYHALCFFHS